MTRLRLFLAVCVCAVFSSSAAAQDGGWYEWLQKMSGPTLMGFGTEVNVFCLDPSGQAFNCYSFFGHRRVDVNRIKHEFDFRFALLWNTDDRLRDPGSIRATKLMVMYHYRPQPRLDLAAGLGFMPIFGGPEVFSRGVVTPLSVAVFPFDRTSGWRRIFARFEENYLTSRVSAADFGSTAAFAVGAEWRYTIIAGVDLRR